jgi:predicted DNA-binding protein YlxM (UPF0122 family)
MQKGRFIYNQKLKDYKVNGKDIELGIYGIFDTKKVKWNYFIISYYNDGSGFRLTEDVCTRYCTATYDTIEGCGKQVTNKEEGVKFIQEYKIKWETGSNNTTEEIRDKKLDDILDK